MSTAAAATPEVPSTLVFVLLTLLAVVGGVGNAAAVTLGATLTEFTGSGIRSAFVNFAVASTILYSLVFMRREWRVLSKPSAIYSGIPWYIMMAPGFIGSTYVTCSILLLSQIEYATFGVFNLGGQFFASNVIDHFGINNTPKDRMSMVKVVGNIVVLAGAMLVQGFFEQLADGGIDLPSLGWAGLALLLGCIAPFQAIFNRNAAIRYGSPLLTAAVSFTFGLMFLTLWGTLSLTIDDTPMKVEESRWFNWLGGVGGTVSVSTQGFVPKVLGTGLFFALVVLGQLLIAILIDATQFIPGAQSRELTALRIVGIVLVFLGTVLLQVAKTIRSKNISTFAELKTYLSGGGTPEQNKEESTPVGNSDGTEGVAGGEEEPPAVIVVEEEEEARNDEFENGTVGSVSNQTSS